MAALKPGSRWRSATCATEVVVVKVANVDLNIECGGAPMVAAGESVEIGSPAPGLDGGTQLGKRYTDDDETIELLCTKAGAGTLAVSGIPLEIKSAKPLPASD